MKVNRGNYAVAEVFGTLLLIVMAVSTFSAVSYVVIHPAFITPSVETSFVNLEGAIQQWNVTFLHIGGYDLETDVKITVTVGGGDQIVDVPTYLNDHNLDGYWNIGEMVIKYLGDITGQRVEGKVIEDNKIIWQGVLQNGTVATIPYVITDHVEIGKGEARLHMTYNFLHNYSGDIQFLYGPDGSEWIETGWISQSGSGTFSTNITDLINGTVYNYTALGNYTAQSRVHIIWGGNKSFNTDDWVRGDWHFDDNLTLLIAEDSSNYDNDGIIHGAIYDTDAINGSALKFEGTGDYVEVTDHDSLDLTEKISIKGWLKSIEIDEAYPGRINEIERYDYSIVDIVEPDIIHVYDKIYAVAFRSEVDDREGAYVLTSSISDEGIIIEVPNFMLQIEGLSYFLEPDIYYIGEDSVNPEYRIFAIAYGGNPSEPDATGSLATVKIHIDGEDIQVIDNATFSKYYGREPRIIRVADVLDPDIYAISFGGSSSDEYETGFLITVSIDNGGKITKTPKEKVEVINTFNFPQNYTLETDIIHVDGNYYAIAYGEGAGVTEQPMGHIITVTIDTFGTIDLIDQFGFTSDPRYGLEPCITRVGNNHFAVSYGGDERQSSLRTIKIDTNGIIGEESDALGPGGTPKSFKDQFIFDTLYTYETDITNVNEDIYLIAYTSIEGLSGTSPKISHLTTISIDDSGVIGNSIINRTQFLENYGIEPSIVELSGPEVGASKYFAITYGGYREKWGFLATVGINLTGNVCDVIDKNDAYKIRIMGTEITAIINTQETLPLSGSITSGWNFIVLTYDSTAFSNQMKLYINGSLVANGDLSGGINTNSDDLELGKFNGILDEVAIYSRILSEDEIWDYYTLGGGYAAAGRAGGGDDNSGGGSIDLFKDGGKAGL